MYAWEKYHLASTSIINAGTQPREALHDAFVFHILHVRDHDLPVELHTKHNEIVSAVTLPQGVEPIGGHSGCSYAISILTDKQVEETIEKIHQVYQALEE